MPHVLDRAKQLINELHTTAMFGEEIEKKNDADKAALIAEFLPQLEKLVDLSGLQALDEKMRKRIDAIP